MSKLKGIVPNLFTLGNLSLGFFSVLFAFQSKSNPKILVLSGFLILLAALCDGLDGFMARLLKAQSELGAQLDSLADLTTFGIAPGILMYMLALENLQIALTANTNLPIGMFIAVIFPICAAYRLARFNVQHSSDSFRGLPSPVAGVIVGLMPLAFTGDLFLAPVILIVIFVLAAFLMVSTVKYAKPKIASLRRFSPLRLALVVVFIVGTLIFFGVRYNAEYSAVGLFFLIVVYIMSGIVSLLIQLIQKYRM